MNTSRSHVVVALATSLVVVASVTASPAGGARPASHLAPACLRDVARTSACRLIVDFFGALNGGRGRKACSLLGVSLLFETGGPSCPKMLALAGPTLFKIVGAHTTPTGVEVRVNVDLPELDHVRTLGWIAVVGREAGRLRILDTKRVA